MPDVARDAGEKDGGVTAFEPAHHRHFGNGMALPKIFAQKERVDAGGVAAHDHVLIVVGKNLRLDEIARAEEIGDGARFAHAHRGRACGNVRCSSRYARCSSLPVSDEISALSQKPKCCATSTRSKPERRAHADIVKLREQKRVDEVPAIDAELRIIDRLLRDLQSRRTRAQETAAAAPIQFHFRFARARDQIGQIEAKEIVAFDYVRIAFLDNCSSGA